MILLPLVLAAGLQGTTVEQKKELAALRKDLHAVGPLLARKRFTEADQALGDVEIKLVAWAGAVRLSTRDPALAADFKRIGDWQALADAQLKVGPPPAELQLSPFYRKHLDFRGLPIVASGKVPDAALVKARSIVREMMSKRPDALAELVRRKVRVAVMAATEVTTDIPEHADLSPKDHWDARARGLGATDARPAVSCAEENLLRQPGDRYRGEDILVHEFAHTVHVMAMNSLDPGFDAAVQGLYDAAMKKGLWKNTYAAENAREYFAEGVQAWFDANLEADPPNGIHNHVNTRKELVAYDPDLAALIEKIFP